MSKNKDKPIEKPPEIEKPVTVVAKRVEKKETLPVIASSASATASPELAAAIDKVREAMTGYCRASWRLAWALIDYRNLHEQLHPAERLTGKQLKEILNIPLTTARIGQIVNCAKAYDREQIDESIDFKVYETARDLNPKMTPAKRLDLVKKHRSSAAIIEHQPVARKKVKTVRVLSMQITPPVEDDGQVGIIVRLNGAAHELPTELEDAIREYADDLFANTLTTCSRNRTTATSKAGFSDAGFTGRDIDGDFH